MPQIDIQRDHHLGLSAARAVVDHVAERMRERFQVETRWEGDTLHFHRSGINGHIEVRQTDVQVHARLGLLLSPLKSSVESEIGRKLDEYLQRAQQE